MIVRPPPSSSKRTLNLQIQLVTNAKQKTTGRESRSASGSSLASVGDTTVATVQEVTVTDTITSSSTTTRATVTPREVDFKSSALRNITQSRDASPTRKMSGQYQTTPVGNHDRKPVHKRTSSMSLDEGLQEKKQSILEQAPTRRPSSMCFPGDEVSAGTRKDARDSELSCLEDANDQNLASDSDTSPAKGKALSRASSVRSVSSNRSYASTTPSAASGISLSGLSTSSSGSRTGRSGKGRIIPLYNLAVSCPCSGIASTFTEISHSRCITS